MEIYPSEAEEWYNKQICQDHGISIGPDDPRTYTEIVQFLRGIGKLADE